MFRLSPNTIKLGCSDGGERWTGGLGPAGVSGSFDVPFGHLAFDEAGVGASSTGRVETATQFNDCSFPAAFSALRGKNPVLGRRSGEQCVVL